MAKRLTNTEKYNDSWFVDLEAVEKLLFYYLIDHVDNAGFYEVSLRHIQFHLGVSKDEILGAIKGLRRGLLGADSDIQNGDKIYLKNFLKHQKMLPLNPFNSYHINALRVFETNFRFVEKHPFLQNLIVKGTKTKDKEIIKNIDTNLIKYLKENQGLTSPIVEVKVIVEVEEDVEEKEKGKIEKSKIEENVYPTFDDFWNEYDKKVGSKEKIKKKWNKLSQKTKEEILDYIPKYKQAQPDKQYRKNPETFLNNQSWKDEIISNGKQSSNNTQSTEREPKINRQTRETIISNSQGWEVE